jgi:hypothetical protein
MSNVEVKDNIADCIYFDIQHSILDIQHYL